MPSRATKFANLHTYTVYMDKFTRHSTESFSKAHLSGKRTLRICEFGHFEKAKFEVVKYGDQQWGNRSAGVISFEKQR